jgi:hypothetical protein
MNGDAYRDMSHYEMQQFIWRKVATFADYANIEQRLDNGKIADVFYQVGRTTVIVEVKTKLRQHLIESAWLKYHDHCQYLAIACPPQPYCADQGSFTGGWNVEKFDRVGIWHVEWTGMAEARQAARLDVKTPGLMVIMSQASSPFTAIGSPACAADAP